MSEAEAGNGNPSDPMKSFRELRDAYLHIWSKSMVEAVNTEGYAQASGAILAGYLNLMAPYRETFERSTLHALQQLGLPTSADFTGLAGRLTNIEMRLDDMEAKLDRMEMLFVPAERFSEICVKLERIEQRIMRSQPIQDVGQSDPSLQTAQIDTVAPKQGKALQPVLQAAATRQTSARAQNAAQKASVGEPKRSDTSKGAK
jgi:hypothetical protein